MPVYECARCNNLTYSASRFTVIDCDHCGSRLHRALEHAFSFDEARDEPRTLGHGDHCCVAYDDPADIAPLCARILRAGLAAGARVLAYPPPDVRALVEAALEPGEVAAIEWSCGREMYGEAFDADGVIERFRALAAADPRPVYVLGGFEEPLETVTTPEAYNRFERMSTEGALDTGIVVVCLYDRRLHDPAFIETGDETHPLAGAGATVKRNERFVYAEL